MKHLSIHPLALMFPKMPQKSFKDLLDDIRQNGLLSPIVLYQGEILDGINRYKACTQAKIEPRFLEYEGNDPLGFVVSANIARRHMSEAQRAMIAARVIKLRKTDPKYRQVIDKTKKKQGARAPFSQKSLASAFGISVDTIKRAKKIEHTGEPELQAAVAAGTIAVKSAAKIAQLPRDEQKKAIATYQARAAKSHRQKSPTGVIELNYAWNHSDHQRRTSFIEAVGVQEIWDAMSDHMRKAMEHIVIKVHTSADPSASNEFTQQISEDLSVPDFLRRN